MTLAALQALLESITGTSFGKIIMDSTLYFNSQREKTYPYVLWAMDGAPFEKDDRSTTIQIKKILTLTAFAVQKFDPDTQSRITVWDSIEGYFDTYLNKINALSNVKIINIDNIKGVYLHEGENSADKEIGIMYPKIIIEAYCNG